MALAPPKNAPQHDLVMTPRELAREIVEHFGPSGKILDPSRGEGAFYDCFPDDAEKFYCELSEGTSFFDFTEHVDWIVTNPPWSKMRDFLKHGMSVSDNIVYLCTLNHFLTRARLRDLREYGFGIVEFYGTDNPPKPWPASGFQLGAAWLKRGYTGPIHLTGTINPNV